MYQVEIREFVGNNVTLVLNVLEYSATILPS